MPVLVPVSDGLRLPDERMGGRLPETSSGKLMESILSWVMPRKEDIPYRNDTAYARTCAVTGHHILLKASKLTAKEGAGTHLARAEMRENQILEALKSLKAPLSHLLKREWFPTSNSSNVRDVRIIRRYVET